MSSAQFPVPSDYAGDPPPAEGLRQALALATDDELRMTVAMLAKGAKVAAGMLHDEQVTGSLEGSAALLGWLAAVVMGELERRQDLFRELGGGVED